MKNERLRRRVVAWEVFLENERDGLSQLRKTSNVTVEFAYIDTLRGQRKSVDVGEVGLTVNSNQHCHLIWCFHM